MPRGTSLDVHFVSASSAAENCFLVRTTSLWAHLTILVIANAKDCRADVGVGLGDESHDSKALIARQKVERGVSLCLSFVWKGADHFGFSVCAEKLVSAGYSGLGLSPVSGFFVWC